MYGYVRYNIEIVAVPCSIDVYLCLQDHARGCMHCILLANQVHVREVNSIATTEFNVHEGEGKSLYKIALELSQILQVVVS